ncbi:N-6 DNA methylase, partial [Escherichia coli]|nr:N-6 DNA methylase [Escherichia coli]
MAIVSGKRERDLHERRQLGAYYTPERLSDMLAFWAIRSSADQVLEPSFGGCGFLQSAVKALKDCGSRNPKNSIFGCDIDAVAF